VRYKQAELSFTRVKGKREGFGHNVFEVFAPKCECKGENYSQEGANSFYIYVNSCLCCSSIFIFCHILGSNLCHMFYLLFFFFFYGSPSGEA
jgi:hypothetical protein